MLETRGGEVAERAWLADDENERVPKQVLVADTAQHLRSEKDAYLAIFRCTGNRLMQYLQSQTAIYAG
jgi:hypothetical protein